MQGRKICQSFIQPVLEYACAVWHPAFTKKTKVISRERSAVCATSYFWQQSMRFVVWYSSDVFIM